MTDPLHPVPLTTDSRQRTFGRYEVMGAALSLVWLVAVMAYVYRASSGAAPVGLVLTLLLVFLPIALIWMTIVTLRSVQDLRAEAARLQEAVEAMRTAFMAGQVRPEARKLTYHIHMKRVILRKLVMGIADATLEVDGRTIYTGKDLRVGLFTSTDGF